MSEHSPESVRNIALAGPSGAGKTTLTESLLAAAGRLGSAGSVEKGTTVADADPQERAFGHSLAASVVGLTWRDCDVNLIDTPGLPDFLGAALAVLPAVETVAVVVNAATGLEAGARRMLDWAAERSLCRLIIVNRMDADGADLPGLLESLRQVVGPECLALNLPAGNASRVADCFFQPGGESDFASVAQVHEQLVDQVVELDEELMALYLEQGEELDPEQLHEPFEAALREGHLVPVCFTSARTGAGVAELLDVLLQLMPNPAEGNPPPFLRETEAGAEPFRAVPDPARHVIAHVVKVEHDPYAGKLAVFRVHQGTITRDSRLYVGDARKAFKVNSLFRLQGAERLEVERCVPGDIGAVARVDEIHFDAVLHDSHDEDHIHLRPVSLPPPVFGLALAATRHSDEQRLPELLARLVEEDPGLRLEQGSRHQTVLRGLGELHLRLVLEKLRERYGIEVETQPPAVPYRETITAAAEGHCRHKKQTGGAGQFGEVFLRVEPLARGAGFQFQDEIRGGTIPASLLPAVEKGVRQALERGAVAGFPLQDVRVTVYDGKTHPVDSKEVAFVIAGRKAFLDAVGKAKPRVLEPLVTVSIEAPSAAMGEISGDLAGRRGRIQDTRTSGDRVTIQALAPMAELGDYASRLKALTGGEASYQVEFACYNFAPETVQRQLTESFTPQEDDA